MSTGSQKRTRSERVAAVELPPGWWGRALGRLRRGEVLLRLGLTLLAAVALWAVAGAGLPPFPYQAGDVPARDIVARVDFQVPDAIATSNARQGARDGVPNVYDQDPEPLNQLQAKLNNTISDVLGAPTLMGLGEGVWAQFELPRADGAPPNRESMEEDFERFRAAITGEANQKEFQAGVELALTPFKRDGLLHKLPENHRGDQEEIFVQLPGDPPDRRRLVRIDAVLIGDGSAVHKALKERLKNEEVAERVFAWMRNQLQETLRLNEAATELARQQAAAAVSDQFIEFKAGQMLAARGVPLGPKELDKKVDGLLRREYEAEMAQRSLTQMAYRSVAILGLVLGLCGLSGAYIVQRTPGILSDLPRLASLLAMVVLAAVLARWLKNFQAELIPILLFAMMVAIAYRRELAIMLSACLAVLVCLAIGRGLGDLLILVGTASVSVMLLDSIRSRSKLIKVGIGAGLTALLLTLAVGFLGDRPHTWDLELALATDAGRNALWALVAGFLITGLLPSIERFFGVLTDISLLELGDVAHPLLQELVRRAPGTYNHSINVASIAEAAAESIGARGLLVRVGAYFHDIGKMLKPGYFVENQGADANRHESLVPAMSTLIIIAHIKDGADLARKHHLPESIIDFIEQHHGTTLVEYFFQRASEHSEANPDAGEVEENAFRYPGPKPQSKEAGVLMLADAVESASRALIEPAPARIESLVRDIATKRLMDGQFDESGLNLSELRTVQDSLVKSLTAVYHGRVKYPEQKTA